MQHLVLAARRFGVRIAAQELHPLVGLLAPPGHQLAAAARDRADHAMDMVVADAADGEADMMLGLFFRAQPARFRPAALDASASIAPMLSRNSRRWVISLPVNHKSQAVARPASHPPVYHSGTVNGDGHESLAVVIALAALLPLAGCATPYGYSPGAWAYYDDDYDYGQDGYDRPITYYGKAPRPALWQWLLRRTRRPDKSMATSITARRSTTVLRLLRAAGSMAIRAAMASATPSPAYGPAY